MGYSWKFEFIASPDAFPEHLILEILDIFQDGFGFERDEGWSHAGVQRALHRSRIVGFLTDELGRSVGYAFFSAPEAELEGTYLLWEDSVCLRQMVQGKGFASRELFEKACSLFPGRAFGWIGGRTQNPLVMLRYANLGEVFPFDVPFIDDLGKKVMGFLLAHVTGIQQAAEKGALEPHTGICRGAYHEGKLGNYATSVAGTERFEQMLRRWSFERDGGDAIIVVSRLHEPISIGRHKNGER